MSRESMTEEEAKGLFVSQINDLAEHGRMHGADPDCAERIAEIIAQSRDYGPHTAQSLRLF